MNDYKELTAKLRATVSVSKRQMLDAAADTIERLTRELAEEHDRFLRYADYSVERDKMIEQLKKDLLEADSNGGCEFCSHIREPIPCEGADYLCNDCPHHGCYCRDCVWGSKWEWRGIVEDNRVEIDTVKVVEIDQVREGGHE